jgi:hypothetical protein
MQPSLGKTRLHATNGLSGVRFFRPFWLALYFHESATHGLRRGLHSCAASRLSNAFQRSSRARLSRSIRRQEDSPAVRSDYFPGVTRNASQHTVFTVP